MYIGQMSIWFTNAAKLQDPPITDEQEIKMIVEDNARTFGFIQICFTSLHYQIILFHAIVSNSNVFIIQKLLILGQNDIPF